MATNGLSTNTHESDEVTVVDEISVQLTPRKYQLELFERAKTDNIIAVLDTGSGKTFIAVLLIKETVAEERRLRMTRRETKLSFFLVNLVPLVFQQAAVIKANCDVKVKHFCGEMGVDLWTEKIWKQNFEEFEVAVMTAQIFLNILRHGFISMSQVNLIVFDECHHTSKRHPYNLIMMEFYDRCPADQRPKIFGMTASPVNTRKMISASQLEHSLSARIFTASDTDELRQFVNRPEEIAVYYDTAPRYGDTQLSASIQRDCSSSEKLQKCLCSTKFCLEALGPWCSDRIWKHFFDDSIEKQGGKLDPSLYKIDLLDDEKKLVFQALTYIDEYKLEKPILDKRLLSPKVLRLIEILECFVEVSEEFCGIVFVERRDTAVALNFLIKEIESLKFLKSSILVGHGMAVDGDVQMRFRQQNRVINAFRSGEINLLIATNVAEEGLDIQPCNVVIRFDFFNTLRAYIQSRGRARKKNSKYIVMLENGNSREQSILREISEADQKMREWCATLPEDRRLFLVNEDDSDVDDDDEEGPVVERYHIVPSTGALLSYESAVSLVYYYCSKLPKDAYCNLVPEFDIESVSGSFVCTIALPNNAPIRTVAGEPMRSRGLAKKSAAFKTCIKLYENKGLNDHLLPDVEWIEEDHEMTKDKDGLTEGARKTRREYNIKIPDFWGAKKEKPLVSEETEEGSTPADDTEELGPMPDELYATIFKLDIENETYDGQSYRVMCMLTRKEFPSVPDIQIFFHGVSKLVKVIPYSKPIKLGREKLELAFNFTIRLFTSIFNKKYVADLDECVYLFLPLMKDTKVDENSLDHIDWDGVKTAIGCSQRPIDLNDIESLRDAVIIDHSEDSRRYFVDDIRYDLTPLSPVPESRFTRELGHENFAAYYKARFDLELQNPNQPMLQVRKISRVMNFLQPIPGAIPIVKGRTAAFLIPEFSNEYTIKGSVFRSAMMIPTILVRLDSLLLVQELRARLTLYVDDLQALEALTTPSANMEMNYERLETLGDAFLKFITTVHLYVSFPEKHEGQLHCQRIRIICNKNLYRAAKRLRLYGYIKSQPFNRRSWRPIAMRTDYDTPELRALEKVQELADKQIADVVEALLGASYLSSTTELALKTAIALAIQFGDITEWKQFHETNRNPPRVEEGKLHNLDIAKIEQICGHTFKNKILIAEALTHASLPNSQTSCYQRLEFLGDAILDFLTVKYLFEQYPEGTPGLITDLKDASVNNHILGAICEILDLHKHIIHFSPKLMSAITEFVEAVDKMREEGTAVGEYWSDIDVPKVLSDVIESMLGAVLVDAEFDIAAPQKMFDRCIQPVLMKHVTPETLKVHPVKELTEYLHKQGCSMVLLRNHTTETGIEAACTIFIHDTAVANTTANNIRTARKTAAEAVMKKIKDEPWFLESVCSCIALPKDDSVLRDDAYDEETYVD
ncbi:2311_t:CDS:2 [Paraglomus brasilianum]|uniref:2311_t:CDS:1 n=1 Tax=Paraglomus brasilianum TaxID=144538 RepID=A0A9N8ZHF4_9GLOM|nr:2311_t:CDS:2 [Paraglomus brasilianum]